MPTEEVKPHQYIPSTIHMGDCAICGHVQEAPIHNVVWCTNCKAFHMPPKCGDYKFS